MQNQTMERKSSGFTQRALAESLGLTERAYQHYELGTREPNIETLVKLSLILDISLHGTDVKNTGKEAISCSLKGSESKWILNHYS